YYVEVPEPQNATPIVTQKRAPAFVLIFSLRVLRSINFDDQHRLQANEIDEERPDRVLPAELEAIELPLAQPRPQLLFGFRGVGAQPSSCITRERWLISHLR